MHEENALFFIHPSALGLREPEEYGGAKVHSSEPTILKCYQLSSERLFWLEVKVSLVWQKPQLDSYSLKFKSYTIL